LNLNNLVHNSNHLIQDLSHHDFKPSVLAKELKADTTNGSSKESLIYAVSANSKDDTRHKSVIENERLGNGISVLITTSVLDIE
jgi:hypothetical protein